MPITGGICRKLCIETAIIMVRINSTTTTTAPCFKCASSCIGSGLPVGRANDNNVAVTNQFTTDGTSSAKNSANCTCPFCQTISVVMSPNGLKAPPALAATTILIQARAMKRWSLPPTDITTVDINNAVARLSATGDIKKAIPPVIQNICRRENPWLTSQARSTSKIPRSSMVLMKVMAANRNRNSSANSSRLWRTSSSAVWVSPAAE